MLALSAELLVHIFGRYNQNIAKIWIFSPFSFSLSLSVSLLFSQKGAEIGYVPLAG